MSQYITPGSTSQSLVFYLQDAVSGGPFTTEVQSDWTFNYIREGSATAVSDNTITAGTLGTWADGTAKPFGTTGEWQIDFADAAFAADAAYVKLLVTHDFDAFIPASKLIDLEVRHALVSDKTGFALSTTSKDAVASDVWVQTDRTITSGGILASDVWAVAARTLTAGTNLNIPTSDANATAAWAEGTRVLTAGTNLNDITAASVWSVGTRALTDKSEFALTTANNNSIASDTWIQAARTVTDKTGYSLAATGLDSITATEPTGVATTFPQMLVQLWRRFFGKTTMTATQIKTYKEDGTTVVSTQTISDDNTTQTQGESS